MSQESRMSRLIERVLRWPLSIRLFLGAFATAVPIYFAAYLSYSFQVTAQLDQQWTLALHVVTFLVLLTLVIFVARYLTTVYHHLVNREQQRVAIRLQAYTHLDRLLTQEARLIMDGIVEGKVIAERMIASRESLQAVVEATYEAFEAAYGRAPRTEDRIDFEVTFMTRSYLDPHITIPAYANRDARAPRSMVLRQQTKTIYDSTVTAMVYREARPSIHIIEDTVDPGTNYQELYPDQKKRIRSSIVFPVLSHTNELLGTLVVHCDRSHFFGRADEKYWNDLLEVFAKRLAVIKLKLDKLAESGVGRNDPLGVTLNASPF